MAEMPLADLSQKMRGIDIALFATKTEGGEIAARPMSNNGDVDYDGDSWFFTDDRARLVRDIEQDEKVQLSFAGKQGLLGRPGIYVSVEGRASLIRDKVQFEAHWTKDVDRYFPDGVDTPGIVLIKVRATRLHYWDGEDEGEIVV